MTTAVLGITLALSAIGHATEIPILGAGALPESRTVALGGTSGDSVVPRDGDIRIMLAALNTERASRGLAPLGLDPSLCKIARGYATEMATRRFFGHRSPEGLTPFERMDQAHYRYGYAGENIALDADPVSASEALWHSSAPSREYPRAPLRQGRYRCDPFRRLRNFVEDFSD